MAFLEKQKKAKVIAGEAFLFAWNTICNKLRAHLFLSFLFILYFFDFVDISQSVNLPVTGTIGSLTPGGIVLEGDKKEDRDIISQFNIEFISNPDTGENELYIDTPIDRDVSTCIV